MKKLSTYLSSLLISIFLVLLMVCSIGIVIVDINVTPDRTINLTEKKDIAKKALAQADRQFREISGATGIPANVYTDHLDADYIQSVINIYINEGFSNLKSGKSMNISIPENKEMEASVDKFFSDLADKTGYEINDDFNKKLTVTKQNAYKIIGETCDVYKFTSLKKHGVLSPASKVYRMRSLLTACSVGGTALMILLMLLVNRREKKNLLYWAGISAVTAGAIGMIPSIYLLSTKYFNAFSIKQPQIFAAYTGGMFGLTEAFMAASIAVCAAGAAMIVLYAVIGCCQNSTADAKLPEEKQKNEDKQDNQ